MASTADTYKTARATEAIEWINETAANLPDSTMLKISAALRDSYDWHRDFHGYVGLMPNVRRLSARELRLAVNDLVVKVREGLQAGSLTDTQAKFLDITATNLHTKFENPDGICREQTDGLLNSLRQFGLPTCVAAPTDKWERQ